MHKYLNILFIITLFSCDNNKKISDSSNLSKVEANNLRNELVKSYISEIKAERIDENNNKVIKINDLELKYELRFFGKKPIENFSPENVNFCSLTSPFSLKILNSKICFCSSLENGFIRDIIDSKTSEDGLKRPQCQ